jgi:hypothetical protein
MRLFLARLAHRFGRHCYQPCVLTDLLQHRFRGQACRFCGVLGESWEWLGPGES